MSICGKMYFVENTLFLIIEKMQLVGNVLCSAEGGANFCGKRKNNLYYGVDRCFFFE